MAKAKRGANGRFQKASSRSGGTISRSRSGGGTEVVVVGGGGGGMTRRSGSSAARRVGKMAGRKAWEKRALIGAALTGLALGEIHRSNTEVPHIDILGKNGTIAAVLVGVDMFVRPKGEVGEWLGHAGAAAVGIATYEWRATGSVSGRRRGVGNSREMQDVLDKARGR